MENSKIIRKQILEVVKNQLASNTPPEIRETYNRLLDEGYDEKAVKEMIGQCVAVEIYSILKNKEPYNNERYVRNLEKLPSTPGE